MNKQTGFTLIELMIAVSITGILAATAYPSLQAPLLKARRIDGLTALMQLQMTQERWRSDHSSYASLTDLAQADASPSAYYRLNITSPSAQGFEAIAVAQGMQAGDGACKVLKLVVADGNTQFASGTDLNTDNTAAVNKRCWIQ